MTLGYETQVVNGQMVPVAPGQAFNPLTFGQEYAPSQAWLRQGQYGVPPVMPSPGATSSGGTGMYGGATMPSAVDATGNAFHPTKSPLWWGLGFLVAGLLMLQFIHYGK